MTEALRVVIAVRMLALRRLAVAAVDMIAVVAHTLGVMLHVGVRASRDLPLLAGAPPLLLLHRSKGPFLVDE